MKKFKVLIPGSLQVAYKIFRRFDEQLTDDEGQEIHLDVFSNCREQGLVLTHYRTNKRALFSEKRNSDSIVIYHGASFDYDITTHLPRTDEVWAQATYFSYGDYDGAVKFLREWLFTPEASAEQAVAKDQNPPRENSEA